MNDPKDNAASPRPRVPTLADVAQLAGVSTATVSRCLNSPEKVDPRTRERVQAAVDELGYAPNFGARALAARRTNMIGAVIPTMENAIFARGVQAFQEELGRHGITLLVASSAYEETVEAEQIRTLAARGADALLLIGHHRAADLYEFLRRREVPVLVAWAYDSKISVPSIGFDNRAAMAGLAREALKLGHRRIGMISAHVAANDRARERLEGVRLAMADAGHDPNTLALVETHYGLETGGEAFRVLMDRADRPSVVMCGNDVLAVGALRAAKAMGLSVPGDVSITGFDDIEIATLAEPTLTTVHVPHREMGRRAAEMLVALLKEKTPLRSVELPTEIRLRRSLGPAPD